MTGKELYEKYTANHRSEYAQTLLTIIHNIDDEIYPLLEQAEAEGKRLKIDETNLPRLWDNFTKEDVILV